MQAAQYIAAALARSASARPDLLVTASGELLEQLNRIVEELFVDASAAHAPYFHTRANLPFDVLQSPAGWPWSADILRPYYVAASSDTTGLGTGWVGGDEIVVVSATDSWASPDAPAVVGRGRAFMPTGQTGHPTGGSLVVEYARRPVAMTGLSSVIDAAWPAEHDGLVIDRLALWLAQKDGRLEDLGSLEKDESLRFARFAAAVGVPVPIEATRTARLQGARQQRT